MSDKRYDSKNRWRNKSIAFRGSPEEAAELDKRWRLCGYSSKQDYFPNTNGWVTVGLCALFIFLYVILSYIPVIAAIPAIAGGIILTGLFWVPADYIGNDVARIIVKVLILAVCGLVELAIFANATVPWLEGKEDNKPRIRIEK